MTGKEYMRRRKRQDERGGKDLVKAGKSRRYLLYYQFVCLFLSLTKFPKHSIVKRYLVLMIPEVQGPNFMVSWGYIM